MTEVRVAHKLGRDVAKERLAALARQHDIEIRFDAGGYGGEIEKSVAFLGKARARFAVEDAALVLHVLEAPAFLSEATVRQKLEEALSRMLV